MGWKMRVARDARLEEIFADLQRRMRSSLRANAAAPRRLAKHELILGDDRRLLHQQRVTLATRRATQRS